MTPAFFVTGISTDIGKTFFVEEICRSLKQEKIAVSAIKPIASGFSDKDKNSDTAKILAALGLEFSLKNFDAITPWRFEDAASPHQAAKAVGKEINFLEVKNFCEKKILAAKNSGQILFIEGAGGVMTPINNEKTFLDLMAELQIPVLLLSANYLGSISHTLCAVEALKSRKVSLKKIIINQNLPFSKSSLIEDSQLLTAIENFTKIDTVFLESFVL